MDGFRHFDNFLTTWRGPVKLVEDILTSENPENNS